MRKKMLIAAIVGLVLLLFVGLVFWRSMGAPFYTPGMVRAGTNLRGPLDPPQQGGDNSTWQVEDDIRISFTAVGNGRPILVVHGGPGYPLRPPLPGMESLAKAHKLYCFDQRGCGRSTRP